MTVAEAEKAVARILADLEKELDSHVEHIEIQDYEVTQFTDDRVQYLRQVAITLKRKPGTRWKT